MQSEYAKSHRTFFDDMRLPWPKSSDCVRKSDDLGHQIFTFEKRARSRNSRYYPRTAKNSITIDELDGDTADMATLRRPRRVHPSARLSVARPKPAGAGPGLVNQAKSGPGPG